MSKPVILVVEDNPGQQKLMRLLVEHLGCRIVAAANSTEALQAFLNTPEPFSIVLMDWSLSDSQDGLYCTGQIRKLERSTGSHVPIIVVTAHAFPGDRQACLAAGADDYLKKPFSLGLFERTLKSWLRADKSQHARSVVRMDRPGIR